MHGFLEMTDAQTVTALVAQGLGIIILALKRSKKTPLHDSRYTSLAKRVKSLEAWRQQVEEWMLRHDKNRI